MKQLIRLALFIASFCVSASSMADVQYSFNGFFGNNNAPNQTDFTGAFAFTVADYIVVDADISPSAMINCHAGELACSTVHFYQDAHAAGLTGDLGMQAIEFVDSDGLGRYYYFAEPSFSTPGIHTSDVNDGTLTVSTVPEPASWLLVLAGLGLIGAVATRRHTS